MSDQKKKRMSLLDNLAAAGAAAPAPGTAAAQPSASRPLRAARGAVDSHVVWDLDPDLIADTRIADRLDPTDVADLRDSIEATGQTVPILVRRDPAQADRFLLVYGRRRLEAVRSSSKVNKIKALIAQLDDDGAVEAQVTENMARRDLSYIEKALFAHELVESGFGTQQRVAEVLTVSKSSISMALGVIAALGVDLVRAIGPAHGIGRPKWEGLAKAVEATGARVDDLALQAEDIRSKLTFDQSFGDANGAYTDPSVATFETISAQLAPKQPVKPKTSPSRKSARTVMIAPDVAGRVTKSAQGVEIKLEQGPFADWLEDQAQVLLSELHDRWQQRRKT
ncbi:plasmid partitioning protein RepB [Nereida sp. MMG025]|uniref:plasmid partitioning protein RepB n=1 Tax=Nereida sp. MMG025 TaxID=2909981 RepID=UPI001F030719|nr:plasmid partitioning protein RepB [Nereida sp. MMG025]MCF6445861.1 plasmid partitioning protein RepB [Nereida sp. MMG025]